MLRLFKLICLSFSLLVLNVNASMMSSGQITITGSPNITASPTPFIPSNPDSSKSHKASKSSESFNSFESPESFNPSNSFESFDSCDQSTTNLKSHEVDNHKCKDISIKSFCLGLLISIGVAMIILLLICMGIVLFDN